MLEQSTVTGWFEADENSAAQLADWLEKAEELFHLRETRTGKLLNGVIVQYNGGGREIPTTLLRLVKLLQTWNLEVGLGVKVRRVSGTTDFTISDWTAQAIGELSPRVVVAEAETWTKSFPGGQIAVTGEATQRILDKFDAMISECGVEALKFFWPATYQWHPSFESAQRVTQRGWGRFNYYCDLIEMLKRVWNNLSPVKIDGGGDGVYPRGLTAFQVQAFLKEYPKTSVIYYGLSAFRSALEVL